MSNTFTMEDWQADETTTVTDGCSSSWCTALLWIVPAKVAGTWNTPNGALTLTQNFQMLSGTLGSQAIQGRLHGNEITITAGTQKWTGMVDGNTIKFSSPGSVLELPRITHSFRRSEWYPPAAAANDARTPRRGRDAAQRCERRRTSRDERMTRL